MIVLLQPAHMCVRWGNNSSTDVTRLGLEYALSLQKDLEALLCAGEEFIDLRLNLIGQVCFISADSALIHKEEHLRAVRGEMKIGRAHV